MPARHAILLTEHAAKHAHPERASRAEGSLLAASLPIPVRFTQLLSRRQPASITPLPATLTKTAGCVPTIPILELISPITTIILVVSFQTLTKCKFRNSFVLIFMQIGGGVYTLAVLFSKPATRMKARNLALPHPAFVTSLHLCFITSFFHYNRCASIRGRNEFPPASRRNPHRLRAPLLGRQHHGALRASLVLRRVCLFGPLPSRSPQLSDGARHEFDRALWRPGMVPGDLRRRDRRPARIPPRPLSGLSDPRRLVLLAWFDRFFVACAGAKLFATGSSGDDSSRSAALRGRTGEALRGRYDRAGLPGECPLHRLLHLLHFGEHRRRDRTLAGGINQRTSADSHRVPDGGAERVPNVFRRARVLQGTAALRRNKYREHRRDAGQFRQGAGQSQ